MTDQVIVEKKTRYHHGDLRAQLVEATRRLVEEKGPDSFSVAEACREAGVSTAAPYKHFSDKNEMIRAVITDGMLRQQKRMLDAIKDIPEGSPDRITALGKVYVEYAMTEPGVFRLTFGLSEHHSDYDDVVACGMSIFEIVVEAVAECLGRDVPTEEDRRRAFMLWCFVQGLSFLTIDGKVNRSGMNFGQDAIIADMTRRMVPECFT